MRVLIGTDGSDDATTAATRALETGKFDVVHIHTPFIAHYAAVRFARENGLPVVATYHTFFEDYLHHYVPIMPRGIGRWLARRFTLDRTGKVSHVSVEHSSGRNLLDEEALAGFRRIELPPPPSDYPLDCTIPVKFNLH